MRVKDSQAAIKYFDAPTLEGFEDFWILGGYPSRRGQAYYYLCHKESLEISVYATEPDGIGAESALPDFLYDMIKNGDIL